MSSGWRGRILLVDDEREIRTPFATWLRAQGYDVVEAEDGVSGLERAIEIKPPIAIIDVMMPRMSGWDLARELKHALPAIQIVVLTSIGTEMNRLNSPQFGADAFHDKPFEFKRVDETIQQLIARSEVR